MGRPLISVSFTTRIGSERLDAVAERHIADAGPRRWCEMDADPDQDAWWTGKDVVIESFIDRPVESANAHVVGTEVSTIALPAVNMVATQQDNIDSGKLMQQDPTQIQNHQHNIDRSALFPERFTISEEELARVTLDSIVMGEGNNEDDDDFELAWDEESDEYYEEDMDVDEADGPHSDASTPAPSTPVMDPFTEPSDLIALPTRASSMHEFSNCMLPAPATSTNAPLPLRQGSLQLPTSSMGPQSAARSVVRIRGFAVHSPRAELVL
jgi:hypothetical protein